MIFILRSVGQRNGQLRSTERHHNPARQTVKRIIITPLSSSRRMKRVIRYKKNKKLNKYHFGTRPLRTISLFFATSRPHPAYPIKPYYSSTSIFIAGTGFKIIASDIVTVVLRDRRAQNPNSLIRHRRNS